MTRRGLIALSVAATTLLVAGAALTIAASGPSATAACLAAFRAGNDDGQCYAAEASGSVVAAFLRAARGVAPEGLDVAADAGLAPALAVRALGQLSRADVSPQARAFALTDLRASAQPLPPALPIHPPHQSPDHTLDSRPGRGRPGRPSGSGRGRGRSPTPDPLRAQQPRNSEFYSCASAARCTPLQRAYAAA